MSVVVVFGAHVFGGQMFGGGEVYDLSRALPTPSRFLCIAADPVIRSATN